MTQYYVCCCSFRQSLVILSGTERTSWEVTEIWEATVPSQDIEVFPGGCQGLAETFWGKY